MHAQEAEAEEQREGLAEEGEGEAGDEAWRIRQSGAWERREGGDVDVPRTLPVVICLTAFALSPPRLFTTGVLASRWYWLKDQFLGFEEDELKSWLVLGTAESRRRGFRR